MTILLATGSDKIDKYIKDNALGIQCDVVASRRYIIEKNKENHYDLMYLSSVLPGRDSIREIVFETQRESGCRIVYLVGTTKPRDVVDLFLLGVRDFIYDPIDPKILVSSITETMSYGRAASKLKGIPDSSKPLIKMVSELLHKNAPAPPPEITPEAKEVIRGLLKLLQQNEGNTVEESMVRMEEGISNLLLSHQKSLLHNEV